MENALVCQLSIYIPMSMSLDIDEQLSFCMFLGTQIPLIFVSLFRHIPVNKRGDLTEIDLSFLFWLFLFFSGASYYALSSFLPTRRLWFVFPSAVSDLNNGALL